MRLKGYEEREGKRVWLGRDELDALLNKADDPHQRLALMLAGRVGLRRSEITQVKPRDFVKGPTGKHVRIWEDYAKQDHYREPPVPDNVAAIADTLGYEQDDGETIIGVDDSTVYRWAKRAADELLEETGDEGWRFVDVHDLRRTWGTDMLEQGVLPSVVMEWGGWRDWETFRKHYLGEFSPGAIQREREKVDYLDGTRSGEPSDADLLVGPTGSRPWDGAGVSVNERRAED